MTEYIERDAVLKTTDILDDYLNDFERLYFVKAIKNIPTADVVEVVRCGQCQHWKINPHNLYGGYCPYSERASLDHFCSYGKRKEVANNG